MDDTTRDLLTSDEVLERIEDAADMALYRHRVVFGFGHALNAKVARLQGGPADAIYWLRKLANDGARYGFPEIGEAAQQAVDALRDAALREKPVRLRDAMRSEITRLLDVALPKDTGE